MKEKTETENTSFNAFDTKKKTEVKSDVKKEAVKEVKQEVKEVAKESVPEVKADATKIQDINSMSDAEIEAYLKKRKAERDAFTITGVKVPMNKLVQASVAPVPQMNPTTFMKNAIYNQNRLRAELNKKG